MPARPDQLHLGVLLAGAGHHPGASHGDAADPARLLGPDHHVALAHTAERGTLDFVALPDAFGPVAVDDERFCGRLDAQLLAARLGPATRFVGLVPTVTTTHTEPFHASKNLATLDWVSLGRGGWHVDVSTDADTATLFGRKPAAPLGALYAEAHEYVDAVRRLWDSWEDDAIIRDVATGRYVDADKLHYVDVEGRFFSVRGPSITPRSPQAQLPVVVTASPAAHALVASEADIALVHATTATEATQARRDIRAAVAAAGRRPDDVTVLAVVDVLLGDDDRAAARAHDALEAVTPAPASDTLSFVGTAEGLADLFGAWHTVAAADGFLVRPARLPADLDAFVRRVVPVLRDRRLFRRAYESRTLRGHLGLSRPANRYATAS